MTGIKTFTCKQRSVQLSILFAIGISKNVFSFYIVDTICSEHCVLGMLKYGFPGTPLVTPSPIVISDNKCIQFTLVSDIDTMKHKIELGCINNHSFPWT